MLSNHDRNLPVRGYSTPPASWKSQHSPVAVSLSERKNFPSGIKRDLFHVIHKVPAGDSPYVRAKHVQLIEKDPGRAISLFWSAINSGDRVDSALKDMAVVMKQLNRSDEAIEAIKSFRHLCPYESQESLDNVLVELYKRSGRVEEEIEMLQRKLKNIEEGIAFGGKKTKIARSQGRKVQITVEQEKSRILGNLAWAYMQHHDYGLAEQHYRKALSLEQDKNKKCNLAICLMHMNRIPEAKSLVQAVRDACRGKQMDESYAKSFERAVEMLSELESKSVLKPTKEGDEKHRFLASPPGFMDSGNGEKVTLQQVGGLIFGSYHFGSPGERSDFSGKKEETCRGKELISPALYTQPRRIPWRLGGEGEQRKEKWEEDRIQESSKNMLSQSHTFRNLNVALDSTEAALSKSQFRSTNSATKNWADIVEEEEKHRLLAGKDLSPCFDDENQDSNIILNQNCCVRSPVDNIREKLEAFGIKDEYDTSSSSSNNSVSPRNRTARRSLCFSSLERKKSSRLQVFRDITPNPDSP